MIQSNAGKWFKKQANQKSCLLAKSWNKLTCLSYCVDFSVQIHSNIYLSHSQMKLVFILFCWELALFHPGTGTAVPESIRRGPPGWEMAVPIKANHWSGSIALPHPCWFLFPLVSFPSKKQTLGGSSSITIFKIPALVSSIQEKFMSLPALGDLLQIL